ncbi:hypothetical protein KVV02_007216 [Mortierella alpina]|uniref:Uncharacterized protein n=1 Tax=Mortierella alpina TaxID=64518 RepID=A0A9P8A8M4_MORAP|nr:hypothetical protein KVV02_007216 [Mortierella alpina]
MRLSITIISLSALAWAASAQNQCNVDGKKGICVGTSYCSNGGGHSTAGYCPNDPRGVQCCTYDPCTISDHNPRGGTCIPESACTHGSVFAGRCGGPAQIKCCVTSPPYGRD